MTIGELSFQSLPSLSVTWTIPDFFQLADESDYSLQSPDFTFADGRHCLRLFQSRDSDNWSWFFDSPQYIEIELVNSIDPDPGRALLYEVVLKATDGDIHLDRDNKVFSFSPFHLEEYRDVSVPDGTLTVLCSVRSREPGSPESGGAQTQVFPPYRMTGNLSSESFPFLYVTWRIPAYFQLTRESTHKLVSPEFPFADRRYRLLLNPNVLRVFIHLENMTDPVPERYVSYAVGLKSTTGEEIGIRSNGPSTKQNFGIRPRDLDDLQPVHFPDGHLTVFCCMRSREPSSPKSAGSETAGSKAPVPQAAARPKSSGAETSNEEDDKEALPGISKLSSDLGQVLKKMPDSDASLVVSGKEFRAHKIMLRARSKVFDAMFGHETAERASGRVVIDDLEPDSFGDFLEYLHTGTVGAGLSEDAFGLYKAAVKYDVPTLKAECVAHMGRSLSVDSFCDVLALALQHSDKELLSQAILFFKENMARIIVTVKWQQFMIDNGTSANEMFIRAIVPPGQ